MIPQVRSELRKMATTRTNIGLLLGLVALILLGVVGGAFSRTADLSLVEDQREVIGNGAFAALFAAMIGVMAMTSEFRHGTIRATFVFTPARTRVVVAKVLASSLVGVGFGALGAGLALGAGVALIRARGFDVAIDSGDVARVLVGTMVMSALWAACGVGIGALLRNQALAIIALFAWVFVAEVLMLQYLPGMGRYAPGVAGTAITGDTVSNSSVDLLSAPAGAAVLAAYAAAFVVAGGLAVSRRDVT